MAYLFNWKTALGAGVSAAAILAATSALGQSVVQKTVENRVMLAFHVNETAVAEVLPEGWVPVTLPKGPVAGSNLIASFFDKLLILDGEGKPAMPSSQPVLALVAYGQKDGVEGLRSFITHVFEAPPVTDPFGNSEAAEMTRVATMKVGPEGRFASEAWTVAPDSGGSFTFALDYEVTGYGWAADGKSVPFAADDPEYFEIYQYDQLAELAMNATLGRELKGDVTYSTDIPALTGLFDGTESLVAVVSIPVYLREVVQP